MTSALARTGFGTLNEPSLTLKAMQRWYQAPRSFTRLLPYVDYEVESQSILLEDGRSRAALLELMPVPCEARPPEFLASLHKKLQTALVHALLEDDPPWVLQLYLQREPVSQEWVNKFATYVDAGVKDSVFTQQYLELLAQHLRNIETPSGYFDDDVVSGGSWRAAMHRLRAVLYRRLPARYRSAQGLSPAQELNVALDRLMESLRAAGVEAMRLDCPDFHRWLLRWFNPCPALPDQEADTVLRKLAFPNEPAERPYGADLAESLVLSQPVSDQHHGVWYFDQRPHSCISLQRLLKSPLIGHLSTERAIGARLTSLWDRFPEGSCLVLTLIAQPQDHINERLETIEKRAVGSSAEALHARTEIDRARQEIAHSNKLYPASLAVYLSAETLEQLRRREDRLNALLLSEGLQPISREHDLIRLDAYVRNLPANFDPAFDRQSRWARLQYSDHLARLLPLYGRSRGSGHPGILAYNRGGEPFTFDPLSRQDRRKNAHTLIVGPPGSGKSSFLLATLAHQLAIRKPRIFLTEVGRSFELFADYLQTHGLRVQRLTLSPDHDVRLPIFQDALHLKPQDLETTELSEEPDTWDEIDEDSINRDVLAEMELAAALMVTGGEAREVERMKRADRRLLQRAIISAGMNAHEQQRSTVLTEDVARALRSLEDLEGLRRERALDMADCLELYTEGFTGQVFNRPGEHWPEADVTILNLGLFANEGYEDKLALSVIGLVNHVNSLAERTRYQDRQIILCFDEAHIVTTHPLLAPYLTKASKVWGRRYAVWLWLATQNMEDFPAGAKRMLNTLEWWIALYMPPEEVEQLARFRELSAEQKTLLQAVRKEPGKYTEGVLLHDDRVALFRNVPPPLMLALAQTEQHERAERARIMRERQCSELDAACEIARRIEASRGGA